MAPYWGQDMDDLARFCCQNPRCPDHGKRGLDNLTVCGHFGKGGRLRLLYCRTCKYRFSERKGTALFQARLSDAKIQAVAAHLAEGCGVRKTGRLVQVTHNTVSRYSKLLGGHARAMHDELVAFSPAHARGPVRRKMVLRGQKAKALRSR
jgi:LacI family transcriptional regulator